MTAPHQTEGHRAWEDFDLAITVRAVPGTEGRTGRFVCARFSLGQRDGGPPVTSEAIRRVPVAALVRDLARALWSRTDNLDPDTGEVAADHGEPIGARVILGAEEMARLREQGPTRQVLWWVAHVYQLAIVLGDPPTQAVEEALSLPRSTAGRWVTLARREGLLGASAGPGKAGG